MDFPDAGLALLGGFVTIVVSIIASALATECVGKYYGDYPLKGEPVGYTSKDIQSACEWGLVQFELLVIAISAPVAVGLSVRGSANFWIAFVAAGVLSITTWCVWFYFRRADGPIAFVARNQLRRTLRKQSVLPASPSLGDRTPLLGKADLWSALVVSLNVLLALTSK